MSLRSLCKQALNILDNHIKKTGKAKYLDEDKPEVVEFIVKHQLGFLSGNVVKYLCRYHATRVEKNGQFIDLVKACHFTLLEVSNHIRKNPLPKD